VDPAIRMGDPPKLAMGSVTRTGRSSGSRRLRNPPPSGAWRTGSIGWCLRWYVRTPGSGPLPLIAEGVKALLQMEQWVSRCCAQLADWRPGIHRVPAGIADHRTRPPFVGEFRWSRYRAAASTSSGSSIVKRRHLSERLATDTRRMYGPITSVTLPESEGCHWWTTSSRRDLQRLCWEELMPRGDAAGRPWRTWVNNVLGIYN
jgi:hypothetical protein